MRIAVLSDIHANLVALDAVIGATAPVDAVWQLGDIVGYGPQPDEVVDRLREIGAVGVRGNHDAAALGGDQIDWFNPDARRAMEWTRQHISDRTRDWLAALPERHVEGDFTLVHGSPRDPLWEYVTSIGIARSSMAVMPTPFGLHGHTHVPVAFAEGDGRVAASVPTDGWTFDLPEGRALVNPGSVGQPRDGLTTASWLVVDTDAHSVTWRRTPYDVEAVQTLMRKVDLPRRLIDRLSHGL